MRVIFEGYIVSGRDHECICQASAPKKLLIKNILAETAARYTDSWGSRPKDSSGPTACKASLEAQTRASSHRTGPKLICKRNAPLRLVP